MPAQAQVPTNEIRRVTMLVHPLFGVDFTLNKNPLKNIRYLLGRWGREVVKATKDQTQVVVIINLHNCVSSSRTSLDFLENIKMRFIQAMKKRMGKRLFVYDDMLNPKEFIQDTRRRGFHFSLNWNSRVFGEYWNKACVHLMAGRMRSAQKEENPSRKKTRVNPIARLSVQSPLNMDPIPGNKTLGHYFDFKKQATALRKKERKLRRRK